MPHSPRSRIRTAPLSREPRWTRGLWSALLLASAVLVLSPLPTADSGLRLAGWLSGYAGLVATQLYGLIKVAMPWVVAGLLLALAWPADRIRQASIVLAPLCLLAGAITLPAMGWSEIRDLLYVFPGLALGFWFAERTARSTEAAVLLDEIPAEIPVASPAAAAARREPESPSATQQTTAQAPASLALRALSVGLLAAGVFSVVDFPLWRLALGLGLAAYLALLALRPNAWLVVVPAALPLLDLAHWSGRFFWDEFDLLMLATLAAALWHNRLRSHAWQVPKLRGLLATFLAASAVSLALGVFPLQAIDLNAFSAYWSHYNGLRVAKGLLWGLVLFALYRSLDDKHAAFLKLAAGMALGVLGVSVWALWEQAQFAGASTTLDYRVTASFSSMHTGGGHFEAYLVLALPFLWGGFFLARSPVYRGAMAAIFLLGAYAMLSTVARGGALALAAALVVLVLGTWRARRRTGRGRGFIAPLALGGLAVTVMVVGVSSGFWQQRIGQTADDASIRWQHWSGVLALRDRGFATALFGQGLGTLPAVTLASRLPAEAGSYRYADENGNPYFALNSAGTLYMAQRVPPRPGERLTIALDARVPGNSGGLEVSLCEKNLFNSRQCQWLKFDVKPGGEGWQHFTQTFDSGAVGAGNVLSRRPVQLSLYNPVAGTVVKIDNVRLIDAQGDSLLKNGDFTQGGDFWLFKSGDHLFWHAKNLWVHLVFEQGWVGVGLFGLVLLLAAVRLTRAALAGGQEPTVWLAALAALVTLGVVESFMDAPRLAQWVVFVLCVGAAWDSVFKPRTERARRTRHRSRQHAHAEKPVV
jgi:hypothetical protein